MSPNDSNDLYVASEDAAPTPPDWMLTDEALIAESMGFDPRQDIASEDAAADYSLDVPTIAETIATARGMLSPRARSGLDALPADEQAAKARAVVVGGCLAEWDRYLSEGQPWPDTIEGTP